MLLIIVASIRTFAKSMSITTQQICPSLSPLPSTLFSISPFTTAASPPSPPLSLSPSLSPPLSLSLAFLSLYLSLSLSLLLSGTGTGAWKPAHIRPTGLPVHGSSHSTLCPHQKCTRASNAGRRSISAGGLFPLAVFFRCRSFSAVGLFSQVARKQRGRTGKQRRASVYLRPLSLAALTRLPLLSARACIRKFLYHQGVDPGHTA